MTLAPKCEMMPVFGAALTSRSRSLGVRKEHDTGLALVDERLQAGLDAVIGLDLAAEAVERDDVAHLRLAGDGQAVGGGGGGGGLLSGRGRGRGLGRTAAGLDGLLDLLGHLGDLGLLLLGRRLRGRRGRGLALAEFDGHGCDGRGDSGGVWDATWTTLVAKGSRDNGWGRTEKATALRQTARGWRMEKRARWMEERRSGAWVDVSNINRTSKGGCARPSQSEGASMLEGRPGQGGDRGWNLGETGGRAREGGRASVRWADAASSPELPGYLDLPDHSAPFPCILETINCGCDRPSPVSNHPPSHRAHARADGRTRAREAGWGDWISYFLPRLRRGAMEARLDWIIGSSHQSIPPPLVPLSCSPRFPARSLKATACIVFLLSARLARRESAGKKASRHASHV